MPLLDANLSHATYRQFVQRLFGFYQPLEARLTALPWWDAVGFDYAARRKTPRLRQDLQVLGDGDAAITALPQCERLPPLTNEAQLWGCLYVIEGATLGGQIIIKHLHAHLGLSAVSGASFFDGYGAQTGSRWKAFCAAVTARAHDAGGGRDEVLRSANQTFDAFAEWLFPVTPTASEGPPAERPAHAAAARLREQPVAAEPAAHA